MLVRPLAGLTLGLDHRRELLQPRISEEDRELVPDQSLADVRVPVAVRAERRLRVVHVEGAQPVEPDQLVELVQQRVERRRVGHVVPRRPEVAGVETDPEPRMAIQALDERGELLE